MSTKADILAVLAEHPDGVPKDDISKIVRKRQKTIENALGCMRIDGSAVWLQFGGCRWWALPANLPRLQRLKAAAEEATRQRRLEKNRGYSAVRRANGYRPVIAVPVRSDAPYLQAPSIWAVAERIGAQA